MAAAWSGISFLWRMTREIKETLKVEEGAVAGAEKPPLPSPLNLPLAGTPASPYLTDTEMSNQAMHASIHEDNARTLQGILDTLRGILRVPQGQSLVEAARSLVGEPGKPESEHPGHVSGESYLRSRYGAYRGHFAWRELEEAFNAGMNSRPGVVPIGEVDDAEVAELIHGLTVIARVTLHATVEGSQRSQERDMVLRARDLLSKGVGSDPKGEVAPGDVSNDALESDLQHPHPDGWLQSGGLLYRLTDDRHPQNRDEINVMMADGSRSDEARTRRAGELLDRIHAHRLAPVAAPVMGIRLGVVSVSALKALFEAIGHARTSSGDVRHESLLVPEALAIVDDAVATSASDDTIGLNVLKNRIRSRSCAGAILTQDVISIIDSMEQAKLAGSIA